MHLLKKPFNFIITYSPTIIFLALAGIVAGNLMFGTAQSSIAASDNITVKDNYQVMTVEQSGASQMLTRSSTVTVRDSMAEWGYALTARVANNTMPSGVVTIGSSSSATCTVASPCPLPTNNTPTTILTTEGNAATQSSGETTEWEVRISILANTDKGNYTLDIEYNETPLPPPGPVDPGTTLGSLQSLTAANCPAYTTPKEQRTAFDARNNQIYYVGKVGSTCWMMSNLKYAGDGNWQPTSPWADDRYATTTAGGAATANPNDNTRNLQMTSSGNFGGSSTNAYTVAGVANPGGDPSYTNTNANGGFYGYLYNWCAAMGGQPSACNSTESNQANINTNTTICPAGWRLPAGHGGTPANEFQDLNIAVNGGATNTNQGLRNYWLAVYSGGYYSGLYDQGSAGYYWSSTVSPDTNAYDLGISSTSINPGTGRSLKSAGFAVRCVIK